MASALSLIEVEIELIESSLRRQRVFRDRHILTLSLLLGTE